MGSFGPTAAASAGLNQLLKTGYLRGWGWGWRYALPGADCGELIRGLAEEVRRREELENAGVPVSVDEFSRRLQDIALKRRAPPAADDQMPSDQDDHALREEIARARREDLQWDTYKQIWVPREDLDRELLASYEVDTAKIKAQIIREARCVDEIIHRLESGASVRRGAVQLRDPQGGGVLFSVHPSELGDRREHVEVTLMQASRLRRLGL